MRKGLAAGLCALVAGFVVSFGSPSSIVARQPDADAKAAPKFLYGHDLRVRPGGKKDFTPETPQIGVEVFHDEATKAIIGISENGSLAVAPGRSGRGGADVQVADRPRPRRRKAGERSSPRGRRSSASSSSATWVRTGSCTRARRRRSHLPRSGGNSSPIAGRSGTTPWSPRSATRSMGNFEEPASSGWRSSRTRTPGGLIYIVAETGSIATAPAPATAPDPKKLSPPATRYGLVLRVRGADEPDFTDKTKKVGVEVFEDPNANVFFYLTQFGHVATAPNPGQGAAGGPRRDVEGGDRPQGPQGRRQDVRYREEVRHRGVPGQPHRKPDLHLRDGLDRGIAEVTHRPGPAEVCSGSKTAPVAPGLFSLVGLDAPASVWRIKEAVRE